MFQVATTAATMPHVTVLYAGVLTATMTVPISSTSVGLPGVVDQNYKFPPHH